MRTPFGGWVGKALRRCAAPPIHRHVLPWLCFVHLSVWWLSGGVVHLHSCCVAADSAHEVRRIRWNLQASRMDVHSTPAPGALVAASYFLREDGVPRIIFLCHQFAARQLGPFLLQPRRSCCCPRFFLAPGCAVGVALFWWLSDPMGNQLVLTCAQRGWCKCCRAHVDGHKES